MISKINHYEIKELLGRGGMGSVYKAYDTLLDRYVAMKFLLPELNQDAQFLKRFNNEAKLLARLNHPNVATLYNLIHFQDQWIMIMEFVDGLNLEEYLDQYPKGLSLDSVTKILKGVSQGLSYAHSLGVIHRDIKPANIMVSKSGRVKLMDFGIALSHQTERHTKVGNIIGSIQYLAPELIKGKSPTAQTDMYALGIVIYELLTGEQPFQGANEYALMEKHLKEPFPKLDQYVPSSIKNIVYKCTQKNPKNRYSSFKTLDHQISDNKDSKPKLIHLPKIELSKFNIDLKPYSHYVKRINLDRYKILGITILLIGLTGAFAFGSKKKVAPDLTEPFYEFQQSSISSEPVVLTEAIDPLPSSDNSELAWKREAQNLFAKKAYFPPGNNLLNLCEAVLHSDSTHQLAKNYLNKMILSLLKEGDKIRRINKVEALAVYQKILRIDTNYVLAINRIEVLEKEITQSNESKEERKTASVNSQKSSNPVIPKLSIPKEEVSSGENSDTSNHVDSETKLTQDPPDEPIEKGASIVNTTRTVEALIPYNKKIKLFLVERIHTEQPRSPGDRIEIRIKEHVYDGEKILFAPYGKVRAYLKNFKSSLQNKKGLIELVIQQVQAHDGTWINVHRSTFRIPGRKGERINISKDKDLEIFTSESKIITYQINR